MRFRTVAVVVGAAALALLAAFGFLTLHLKQ
jgi:hypothetical protein